MVGPYSPSKEMLDRLPKENERYRALFGDLSQRLEGPMAEKGQKKKGERRILNLANLYEERLETPFCYVSRGVVDILQIGVYAPNELVCTICSSFGDFSIF